MGMYFSVRQGAGAGLAAPPAGKVVKEEDADENSKHPDPKRRKVDKDAQQADENLEDLVRYLKMVRKEIKEPLVDTEYIYSLAKVKKLAELEDE